MLAPWQINSIALLCLDFKYQIPEKCIFLNSVTGILTLNANHLNIQKHFKYKMRAKIIVCYILIMICSVSFVNVSHLFLRGEDTIFMTTIV